MSISKPNRTRIADHCSRCGKPIYEEFLGSATEFSTLSWHKHEHSIDLCLRNLKEEIDSLKGQFYVFSEKFKGNFK